ncbi:MAG TPA: transposase [Elusimicrobia bacterium]|nr:MAG: hypothetical protein A2551_07070 [Elusimicrobia bacterium RIFOXYD2_FULL_34_30]HAM38363.1 transposase [Elusimicrobiota bacterium]
MPRQGRLNIEGGIYHVIQRGIERRDIFRDDADREEFINRLGKGLKETGHHCYGWALIPNHFHLLIRTGVKPLSDLMRKVLTGYAIYFNRRHNRKGYLYQNRYKSILCQEESYLLELVRYIHLNPLRAKLVKNIEGLNRYKWSGHSVLIGLRKADWQSTGEILEQFGSKKSEAIKKYIEFVEDGKDIGQREELTGGGLRRSAGGWIGVLSLKRANAGWQGDERILGDGDFVNKVLKDSEESMIKKERLKKEGWDINKLVRKVCEMTGIKEEEIHRRSKDSKISQARSLVIYWGNKELGITGVELGKYFGITKPSISASIKRGEIIVRNKMYNLTI